MAQLKKWSQFFINSTFPTRESQGNPGPQDRRAPRVPRDSRAERGGPGPPERPEHGERGVSRDPLDPSDPQGSTGPWDQRWDNFIAIFKKKNILSNIVFSSILGLLHDFVRISRLFFSYWTIIFDVYEIISNLQCSLWKKCNALWKLCKFHEAIAHKFLSFF